MKPPTFQDVVEARARITPHLRATPLYTWPAHGNITLDKLRRVLA
jgi:hypothetical protein